MKKIYILLSTLLITQLAVSQPANDDCANAEFINVTTDFTAVDFDISTAVINNEVGCDGDTAADYADIWYDFNMPINGNIFIIGTSSWNRFALYDTCGGTQIQCGTGDEMYSSLTAGTNYKLRVYRTAAYATNATYTNFSIKVFPEVANDDCASAQTLTVTTDETSVDFEIGGATINTEEGCTGTTAEYADIWYDFTMPVNGNLYVHGTLSWNQFALYDACGGTRIQCGNSNELFTDLTATTNYKLRVFRILETADNDSYKSFTIQAFESVTNDDCASAENIVVTTAVSTVNFEIGGATINNEEGCTGTTAEYADIWYDFTMPVNGNLYVDATVNWNQFALYDACGGTRIQCAPTNELFTDLTATTNYKLRVFRTLETADNNSYKSFTIQAFESVTNDDCASAENIMVTTAISIVNFEIGGATINNEEGCTGTTADYADIWYDFTMPVSGNLYVDGTLSWNQFALYDACGGTRIQCGDSNELFTDLTATTNYKLRVFRTLETADNNSYKSFTIQAYENVTNDDCASAEDITVSTAEITIDFAIGGASINNEVGCTGTVDDYADIWYHFTMPVNGNLYVDASVSWNRLALYDSCGGTQMQCSSANQLFTGLSAAVDYKLRLFRTENNVDNAYRSFTIQAFEIINNDDCASAENISVTNTPTTINFGIGGAAINNEVGCSGTTAADYADVWYDFTMPIDGYLFIDGTLSWNNFALYDACNGNELGCFEDEGTIAGLTMGTTYKLRVFRTLALADNESYKSFTIYSSKTLSTNSNTLENSIQIYPNPADTEINISFSENQTITAIKIYDMLGKNVLTTKAKTIDVSDFQTGIYLVKITTKKGQVTKRLVIQ